MEALLEKDREMSGQKYAHYIPYLYQFYWNQNKTINHSDNLDLFKETISKIRRLKEKNIIDDKQFADIIIMIATNFIENEVELRVNNKISKSFQSYFDK